MKLEKLTQIIEQLHHAKSFNTLGHEPEFAILIPLVEKEGQLFLLFEKRSQLVRQPGEICFPGGRKEKGDQTMEDAAIRETIEEIGIEKQFITPLGKLGTLITLQMILHCFVGFIHFENLPLDQFNTDEVEDLLLINVDDVLAIEPKRYQLKMYADPVEKSENGMETILFPSKELKLPDKYHKRWTMGYRDIISYDLDSITIWGITGQILESFINKVIKKLA